MRFLSVMVLTFFLLGCGGGGDDGGGGSSDGTLTGYLTIDGIAGLPYRTESQSGVTGDKGEFRYREGETITFYLGELVFADAVPTKKYMNVLDFDVELSNLIDDGVTVRGLADHKPLVIDVAELTLADTDLNDSAEAVANKVRLLFTLSDPPEDHDEDGAPIFISARLREAVEAYVFERSINFDQDVGNFGEEIEYPEPGATQEQLDAFYTTYNESLFINDICEELEQTQCVNSELKEMIPTERHQSFAKSQSILVDDLVGSRVFLSPEIIEINASDTRIHTVKLSAIGFNLDIAEMEVKATDELPDSEGNFPDPIRTVVAVQNWSPENREFGIYAVGEAGQETSVVANFKVAGDYRWYKKTLRVRLK